MKKFAIILSAVLLVVFGCSRFQRIQSSNDYEKKYAAALRYYENKNYYKALLLFEELIPIFKGTERSEEIQFYYAYSQFYEKQYALASFQFRAFYETFQRSERTEESYFMYAYSLYKDSPKYYLDQSNTFSAIAALQSFINRYPKSSRAEEINKLIDDLRNKLEKKDFENAKLYYKLSNYKSAVVAFENFKKDFPDSKYNEELAYLKIESEFRLAEMSTEDKKKERYTDAIKFYENFVDVYPNSILLKPAQELYDLSTKRLNSTN